VTTSIDFLTVEDVEALHSEQLRLFGGQDGVRDRGALESAVATPSASFDGELLHAGIFAMAAAYAFHLAENQPAALVFLGINGWDVDDPEELLYDAMIGISARNLSKEQLADLLERLAKPAAEDHA
jgi:death-on-curing protein